MRSAWARIAAVVLPVLFVAMGVVHTAHSHPADEASTIHPTCTLCQFHAPVAGDSGAQRVATKAGPGTQLRTPSPDTSLASTPAPTNTTRAPPRLLAL